MASTIQAPTSLVPYLAPPSTWISGVRTWASSEASTTLRINAPSSFKSKYSNSMATERTCANGLAMFKPLACGQLP